MNVVWLLLANWQLRYSSVIQLLNVQWEIVILMKDAIKSQVCINFIAIWLSPAIRK